MPQVLSEATVGQPIDMPERYNTIIAQCRECGEPHQGNWLEALSAELTVRQLCWWCYFWLCHVEASDNSNQVRVDGELYQIRPDNMTQHSSCKGLGGSTYYILFLDGRENPCVKTTNLWTQDRIPERFRERLPDDAVFTDHRWEKERRRDEPAPTPRANETMAWVERMLAGSERDAQTDARNGQVPGMAIAGATRVCSDHQEPSQDSDAA